MTWKAPLRSPSLVTQYQLSYRSGSSKQAHEKWLRGDERSLTLFCSAKQNIEDIEIRPYCGHLVKGPSVCVRSSISVCSKPKTSDSGSSSEDEHTPDSGPSKRMVWRTAAGQEMTSPFVPTIDTRARLLMDGKDRWQLGGMAVMSDGRLLVTDMDNNCLRLLPLPTDSLANTIGQYLCTSVNFECPWDVATDDKDNIYIIDNMAVHVLDRKGKLLQQRSRDIPANPGGIAAGGDKIAIIDMKGNTCEVYKTGSSGGMDHVSSITLGRCSDGQIQNPVQGVAIDDDGNMYVSDPDKRVIHKYDQSGQLLAQIQTGKINPGPLVWHSGCGLLTSDVILRKIWLLTPIEKQ